MTLDEAVKVLNERRHGCHAVWHVEGRGPAAPLVFGKDYGNLVQSLESFEAIAVAEKYEREAGPKPGTVRARIAVAVHASGRHKGFARTDWSDADLIEEASSPWPGGGPLRVSFVTADVLLPETVEVQGEMVP